jgi:hypothetical protein
VPAAAAFAGVDFPFWRNIPYPYAIQWQTLTSGVTANFNLFGQSEHWIQVFRRLYEEHLPFTDLPKLAGNLITKFDTWVAHPYQDAYWDAMNPTDEEFSRLELPILTITGHYDGDQPGAMEFYKRHMRFASEGVRQHHYLIIGPWDHAGTRTPRREVGGLVFGEASLVDLNGLHREWYDWTMKDGSKPEFLEKRIAYYVIGADEWKYVDSRRSLPIGGGSICHRSMGRPTMCFEPASWTRSSRRRAFNQTPTPTTRWTRDRPNSRRRTSRTI